MRVRFHRPFGNAALAVAAAAVLWGSPIGAAQAAETDSEVSLSGNFLAGHVAQKRRDLPAAVKYITQALQQDSSQPDLVRRGFLFSVMDGRLEEGFALAESYIESESRGQIASLGARRPRHRRRRLGRCRRPHGRPGRCRAGRIHRAGGPRLGGVRAIGQGRGARGAQTASGKRRCQDPARSARRPDPRTGRRTGGGGNLLPACGRGRRRGVAAQHPAARDVVRTPGQDRRSPRRVRPLQTESVQQPFFWITTSRASPMVATHRHWSATPRTVSPRRCSGSPRR